VIFFCRIMDDGRPYMSTHFLMEDEMSTIIILPLVEGSSLSSFHRMSRDIHSCCTSIGAIINCKTMSKKKLNWWWWNKCLKEMKWSDVIFVNIFNLYEEEWRCLDKFCLSFKHWTHICTKHHCWLLDECCHKEEQKKN